MNGNPNQQPEKSSNESTASLGYRVDGNRLVVRSGAVLPPLCVKTNQPVSTHDVDTRQLTWCSPIVGLLIVMSGLLLIFVYFIVRRHCTLSYGLSRDVIDRNLHRRMFKIALAAVLLIALVIVAGNDSTPAIVVVFVLFLLTIAWLLLGGSPLSVTKYSEDEFWISGCCPAFLETLKTEISAR